MNMNTCHMEYGSEHSPVGLPPLSGSEIGHTVSSTNVADLAQILVPEVQLAVWQRGAIASVVNDLIARQTTSVSGFRTVIDAGAVRDLAPPDSWSDCDGLIEDLGLLSELLVELTGCERVGLRVETIDRAMCPRFHVDHLSVRLLCTYRGPGTEWIDDSAVDRGRLGAGAAGNPDELSGLLGPGARIERIPTFSVALLKGARWPGNDARGLIHRSPAIEAACSPRVLVAMDPLW